MSSEKTRKSAYRIAAHAISDWLDDYALSDGEEVTVEVRLELEKMRDAMAAAGEVPSTEGVNGAAR